MQSTPTRATPPAQVRRGPMLATLLIPLFMALVAVSVINVGLPAIKEGLGASSVGVQWVLSGYALAFGMLLVPAGRVGDATGRRRVFVIGLSVFTAGSLLAGFAPSVEVLNVARIMQGIGSGLLNPQTIGLIQQHFRGQDRARAFAFFGTTVALATACGPVLGGLLIELLGPERGWRWMFFMNVPIGAAALAGTAKFVPNDAHQRTQKADLDPVGMVLLTAGIVGIMLPFVERHLGAAIWLALPAGIAAIIGWWRWEDRYRQRGRSPMVDIAIFGNAPFRNGIAIVSIYFLGSTSIWVVVALFSQMHLERSAFEAALIGVPSSLLAAVSSQLAGRHVLRFGRRLVSSGFIVALLGLTGTAAMSIAVDQSGVSFWWMALPLSLIGLSQGMTISPNQTLTLNSVDPKFGGVAGGILSLGQRLGQAVGTAMIPGVVFALTESGQSWSIAFPAAIAIIIALTLVALGVSIADSRREKRDAAS